MDKIDWRWLNANGKDLDEPALERLLDEELRVHRRRRIAERLHQRLSMLRVLRERAVLLAGL